MTKDFRWEPVSWGRESWRKEKCPHIKKPLHKQGQEGALEPQQRAVAGAQRAKQKIHHRNHCQTALSGFEKALPSLHPQEGWDGELRLGCGCQIAERGRGRLLWGYWERTTSTQWKESWEKTGFPRVMRSRRQDTNTTLTDSGWVPVSDHQSWQNW